MLLTQFIVTFFLMGLYWALTDTRGFVNRYTSFFKASGFGMNVYAVLTILIYIHTSLIFKFPRSGFDAYFIPVGLLLFYSGACFSLWAKITMKNYWGPPAQHDSIKQTKLITSGPFEISRNPIYLGLLLMIVGIGIAMKSYSVLLCIVIYYGIHKVILKEESLLTKQFGEEYKKYLKTVRRLI